MNTQIELNRCDFCNKAVSVRISTIQSVFTIRLLYAQLCEEHRLMTNKEFKDRVQE